MSVTRRNFLTLTALGGAAVTVADALPSFANALGHEGAPGDISVAVTSAANRFRAAQPVAWRPTSASAASDAILLNPAQKFQSILGFGAAFTDAACFMFNQLSPSARDQLFHELFHPAEMGLNVSRICMGSSDYSTKVYSYDDGDADPELKRFSIDHDREYILPALRGARAANPDLFLFASPWSPPGWMKFNNSMLGGAMRRKYLPNLAQYFLKFLQAYAAAGVPLQAVTPQNEVDTDQDGRMPACIWPQEYEIEFVGGYLGPLLRENNLPTKIWILDHNYNLWGRAIAELDDPKLAQYCNAVAWHAYVGSADMVSKVHQAHPDAEMYWTEGGPDYTSPDYLTDWTKWGRVFTAALRNWCRSITGWNLALDEQGRPNIGPFPCGGLVTIDSRTKEITRSGQYWAFAHFSRAVRRGAVRFESQSSLPELDHVAFENPAGDKVLVVTNPAAAREVTLSLGTMLAPLTLEKESITTFSWR